MDKLPGDYIAGFVDGEGCFALKFRRDIRHERKNKPVYFYWDVEFAISLRGDDREILEKIKKTFGCGNISSNRRGAVRYSVASTADLVDIIVPFFGRYPLRGKKRFDFELWKESVAIFQRNQRQGSIIGKSERKFRKTVWDPKDVKRLMEIHQRMGVYKSKRPSEWKWISKAVVS